MILIPLEVWEQTAVTEHYFSPIMNYQNEGDKGITNITSSTTGKNGNFYYLSFPAATYVLPYFTFKIFGVDPSPLALQIFNLFTHLLSVILLFKLVLFLTSSQLPESTSTIPAIIAAGVYLFSPTPLWFYGNGYTHHTLVNLFILWSSLIALKELFSKTTTSGFKLFIPLTLGILTAYSGYLLAFILCVTFLFKWYKQKQFQPMIVISLSAIVLGSWITYWQYASVIGGSNFLDNLFQRFVLRSGSEIGFGAGMLRLIESLGMWYAVGYLPILLFIVYQFFSLRIIRLHFTKRERAFFMISSVLLFSHHILLKEFTAVHNYSVLIDGILISGLVGVLITKMIIHYRLIMFSKVAMLLVVVCSIAQYYYINRIGDYGQNGDRYDYMQKIGESIRENSTGEDVIFVMNMKDKPSPQVVYYSKRNFYYVNDESSANEMVKELNIKSAKIFVIEDKRVEDILSIGSDI
jgi:hypothetical protein